MSARSGPAVDSLLTLAEGLNQRSQHDGCRQLLQQLTPPQYTLSAAQQLHKQLLVATTDEAEGYYSRALKGFLTVAERAAALGADALELRAYLGLALVHEQTEDAHNCRSYLDRAAGVLTRGGADSLAAALYIRRSSYHRVFGQAEAAVAFARRAVQAAERYDREGERVLARHLLGLLHFDDYDESYRHFSLALEGYRALGVHLNQAFIWLNLARLNGRYGYRDRRFAASDSAMVYFALADREGTLEARTRAIVHEKRAAVFEERGQPDSVIHHLRRAHAHRMAFAEEEHESRVLEIQSRYDDDAKTRRLQEKTYELSLERQRQRTLLSALLILVALLAALAYLYLRLSATKETVVRQSGRLLEMNTRLEDAVEEQIVLREELDHRVKNNLQLILSLLDAQRSGAGDPRLSDELDGVMGRIQSMAVLHALLHDRRDSVRLSLTEYAGGLCRQIAELAGEGAAPAFDLDLGDHRFAPRTLSPLGLILNELITNSLKYATVPDRRLRIGITLRRRRSTYVLRYCDNGPGYTGGAFAGREGGLGNYLIRSMGRQLGGHISTGNAPGACFELTFPAGEAAAVAPTTAARQQSSTS